jgi:hypothetical protein
MRFLCEIINNPDDYKLLLVKYKLSVINFKWSRGDGDRRVTPGGSHIRQATLINMLVWLLFNGGHLCYKRVNIYIKLKEIEV